MPSKRKKTKTAPKIAKKITPIPAASPPESQGPRGYWLGLKILAGTGILLTAYLTILAWLNVSPLACVEGSACEAVQSSRWGSLLGLPTSLFGFLFYAAILGVLLRVPNLERRWRLLWRFSLSALAISLYLMTISLFVIKATCLYCLASLLLVIAILVLVILSRPPQVIIGRWLKYSGAGFVAILIAVHSVYALPNFLPDFLPGKEDPYLKGLAEHLSKNAVMYGASWCSACKKQKSYFKRSAKRLKYVECSERGIRGPQSPRCIIKGINSYPTWFINGKRHAPGIIKIKELAELTGYEPPQ